jgi:hypothetical protein
MDAIRSFEQIAREILADAAETDRREDELHGDARGDELPEQLCTHDGRREVMRDAKRKLDEEGEQDADGPDAEQGDETPGSALVASIVAIDLDRERIVQQRAGSARLDPGGSPAA